MKLKNKIVLITGASSGIGEACAEAFAAEGARVLLCARRGAKLKALKARLQGADVHYFELDVRDAKKVEAAIAALPPEWREIDILVNNAGLALGYDKIQNGVLEHWDAMIDTNVKGLLYVTRFVLPGMIARKEGLVVNVGSISAHNVYSGGAVYCGTKFAVRAITEGLKMDVAGMPIRVSLVNPGLVETEFVNVRFAGDDNKAKDFYKNLQVTPLTPTDIAEAVVFCATRPAHATVKELTLITTDQVKMALPADK